MLNVDYGGRGQDEETRVEATARAQAAGEGGWGLRATVEVMGGVGFAMHFGGRNNRIFSRAHGGCERQRGVKDNSQVLA